MLTRKQKIKRCVEVIEAMTRREACLVWLDITQDTALWSRFSTNGVLDVEAMYAHVFN